MGTFSLAIQVGAPDGSRYEWLEFLVDTGSSYIVVPSSNLRALGVTPIRKQQFQQADGRIVERDVGQTSIRINDQALICTVTFGEGGDALVLGAETLETFALGVDPVGRRLIPVRGLMMAAKPAPDICPCCQRPFEKMFDYPRLLVTSVKMLPIPEFFDILSDEGARLRLERLQRDEIPPDRNTFLEGINRTPEIAAAYDSLKGYFEALQRCEGQEVAPSELLPVLERHGYFRWAFQIPDSELYLAFDEAEATEYERICHVTIHGKGPNFGSAGGPSVQSFGVVAAIHYKGLLLHPGA